MSIGKIKSLQDKITKKFSVCTSTQYSHGVDHQTGRHYIKITIYDEIHNHRFYTKLKDAVSDLESMLAMTKKQFFYYSSLENALRNLKEEKKILKMRRTELKSLKIL